MITDNIREPLICDGCGNPVIGNGCTCPGRPLKCDYQQLEKELPKHDCELMLTHNPHKSNYETVEQHTETMSADWVSEEQKLKAFATQSLWELHWYPSTPVGFIAYAACDLDVLMLHCKDLG